MNRSVLQEFSVFALLLLLAVVGRWLEPAWNFTPLVAVTAFGGFYFRSWLPAVLLPMAVLAISDLWLAPHDNGAVMASVYAMMALPMLLGRLARTSSPGGRVAWLGLCGFVPATLFFVVTNFAVWAFPGGSFGALYAPTWSGLMSCYAAGLPFYRTMLAGDLFYMSVLAICFLAVPMGTRVAVRNPLPPRKM